ncbi:MAG: M48 family metallopeptidase [Myxococcaceae bacterium]|nr:M48 family metallopeptidase [Myxococcaceae bacterium]
MNRSVLMVVVALMSGCATLKSAAGGDLKGAAANAQKMAAAIAAANKQGDEDAKKCPKEDGIIPIQEEKEIGGSVVVGLTQTVKAPYFVEGNPDLPDISTKPSEVQVKMGGKNDLTAYVAKLGKSLASASARPELPWVFAVLEHPDVNAFSAPGGYVVVTTGLLARVKNEAQLAGILGHEIGHVVNRDTVKTYASVKHNICVVAMKGAAFIKAGIGDSAPAEVRKYADLSGEFDKPVDGTANPDSGLSKLINTLTDGVIDFKQKFGSGKEAEFAADKAALELMISTGYEPTEFDSFLQIVEQSRQGFPNHPSNVDRLKALTALRNGEFQPFLAGATNKPELPENIKALIPALPAGK